MNKLRNLSVPLLYSRGRSPPIKTNNSLSLLRLTVVPKRFSTEDAAIVSTDKSTDALEQATNRSLPFNILEQIIRKDSKHTGGILHSVNLTEVSSHSKTSFSNYTVNKAYILMMMWFTFEPYSAYQKHEIKDVAAIKMNQMQKQADRELTISTSVGSWLILFVMGRD
ncbi:14473_t:CDS:2 [Acaulospora morrowiae]|uniref:14473_t:CDS:1 n=1 Tax=Acaulospora morrowiae TaxID=94023 RepID=A0A9N8ZCJ3_9GLOM|nr:14473_t:CDS:2 [Acaulospora morrowiae]